jgi:hypothetical protein
MHDILVIHVPSSLARWGTTCTRPLQPVALSIGQVSFPFCVAFQLRLTMRCRPLENGTMEA